MSVELQPEELGFRRPFDREVTEILKINNPTSSPVAFKVKTTAPKQYCVRPNSGIVKPNGSVDVSVLLQAMKEDPPLDARCRDKFLVQSVPVGADQDEASVGTFWSSVEKTDKSSILEKKIRVHFLPPSAATTNGLSARDENPPAYSSPSPAFGSPAQSTAEKSTFSDSNRSPAASTAESTGIAGAAAAVVNAVPKNQDELSAQLSAAQAKIKELTGQLSDSQVRQRKVAEAQEKVATVVQQSQENGVPLHITAGLCLLSFLIAWLFF